MKGEPVRGKRKREKKKKEASRRWWRCDRVKFTSVSHLLEHGQDRVGSEERKEGERKRRERRGEN